MKKNQTSQSNANVAVEIYMALLQRNFSYVSDSLVKMLLSVDRCLFQSYQSPGDIQQSFCVKGELNRTFQLNASQWTTASTILCNNLSVSDLKVFLIQVQTQLDDLFVVRAEFRRTTHFIALCRRRQRRK